VTSRVRAAQPAPLCEDDVVAAIASIVGPVRNRSIVLGIGDDAALWQPSRSNRSAITTDMLVEGVHFARTLMSLRDAGWRAMTANTSDLAAMGARPVLATVALGIPAQAGVDETCELYAGLAAAAAAQRLAIVGGDLSRAPVLTVAVAAVGEVRASNVKTRAGARPGAVLAVTGPLGAARAGLDLASNRASIEERLAAEALEAFCRPRPRLAEGRFLGASRNVQAMIDCSDGLSTDLDRICKSSGCGATLESVPVAPAARALAQRLGEDPERYALAGGEDFELLVAVGSRAFGYLSQRFAKRFGRPLLRIGTLRPEPGIQLRSEPVQPTGWDHFSP
jgi:thiamine-monophosphate kinase